MALLPSILDGVVAICNVLDGGGNAAVECSAYASLAILLITCMYITYGNIAGSIRWLRPTSETFERALEHGCIAKCNVPDGEDA